MVQPVATGDRAQVNKRLPKNVCRACYGADSKPCRPALTVAAKRYKDQAVTVNVLSGKIRAVGQGSEVPGARRQLA